MEKITYENIYVIDKVTFRFAVDSYNFHKSDDKLNYKPICDCSLNIPIYFIEYMDEGEVYELYLERAICNLLDYDKGVKYDLVKNLIKVKIKNGLKKYEF